MYKQGSKTAGWFLQNVEMEKYLKFGSKKAFLAGYIIEAFLQDSIKHTFQYLDNWISAYLLLSFCCRETGKLNKHGCGGQAPPSLLVLWQRGATVLSVNRQKT